jgi:hypothetical protein
MGSTKVTTDCIIHTYAALKDGYARTAVAGNPVYMHRLAYAKHNNLSYAALAGVVIRHTCDNSKCINPLHLVAGTTADNVRDRVSRGRSADQTGSSNNNAKFTAEQIIELRSLYARGLTLQRELAAKYNVKQSVISNIVNRVTYSDIK